MAAVAAAVVVGVVLDQPHPATVQARVVRLLGLVHQPLTRAVLRDEVQHRAAGIGAVFGVVVIVVEPRAIQQHGIGEQLFSAQA